MMFTWFKFLSFFLVIKGVSNHFITIYKMFNFAFNFILMVFTYQLFMAVIMYLLFSSYRGSIYTNMFYSFRTMYDLLKGHYDRSVTYGDINHLHSYLTIIHILISKIIFVSLIVALFMTIFKIMYVKGDFVCKSYRYEYIEHYQLAQRDGWGYSELVTTPPPLNAILILILPWLFSRITFKKGAEVIGKLYFWLENSIIYFCLIVYSWMIIPLIYIKFIISIFRNLPTLKFIVYLIPWIFLGFPYLSLLLLVDLFNLTRILSDYRDDDASQEEKIREEELQDK